MNEARDPITVVSIEQQYVGHAKEAAILTAGCSVRVSADVPSRFVVVVDEDIDPSNISEVMLAIGTRCNPEDAVEVIKGFPCAAHETVVSPEKKRIGDFSMGKCFIYACKPYSWIKDFPRVNKRSAELLEEASRKWGQLLFRS